MTLNIRPARPAGLPVILSLLEGAGLYTSSVTMQAEVTYLLALDDGGQPLGVIGMEHGQGASLLRSFAVRQDARGRGYSRALLDAAYAVLRGRGDRDIYLFSADEGGYWVHQGYRAVPPQDIAQRLPESPQLQHAIREGWLAEGLGWHRSL